MTDELEIQLSTLRAAREQLWLATLRIGDSVTALRVILRELTALGYEQMPGARQVELLLPPTIDHNVETLHHLKASLDQTVSAVESAAVAHFPPLGALLNPSPLTFALRGQRSAPEVLPAAVAFDPNRFVSSANRPLYDAWAGSRDALVSQQTHLQTLEAARVGLDADLRAARNRGANAAGVVQMQAQLQRIDGEIVQTRGEIDRLQVQVEVLGARLERVAPGTGANLAEIRQLELGESSAAVKQYTEGCVNYIANRINIPPTLARDAYLWNDIAAQNPQLGIKQGDVPLPGSVLVMEPEHSYAHDTYGHVLYVERVEGDTVWVTDNHHADPIRLSELTTETSGANLTYLYLPWHTAG